KIIEKAEGYEIAKESVGSLIDSKGFSSNEGFTLQIQRTDDGSVEIKIKCKDREWNVPPEVMDSIIGDANELNEEIIMNRKIE
ncbi:MAG: hypothetical protein AAB906_00030, partial [Patescibacteria group bacterium]